MKKKLSLLLLIFSMLILLMESCRIHRIENNENSSEFVAGNLIISYEDKSMLDNLKKEVKDYGASVLYEYNNFNSIAIKIPEGKSIDNAIKHFKKVKGVLSVEKDQVMQLQN